ncbi:MAG: hypothetical protein R2825_11870 [Saprospiraceae bacterium]
MKKPTLFYVGRMVVQTFAIQLHGPPRFLSGGGVGPQTDTAP